MTQIKTIKENSPFAFDNKINDLLSKGWVFEKVGFGQQTMNRERVIMFLAIMRKD